MDQKHCSFCKELKTLGCFSRYKDKRLKIGYAYRSQCKECFQEIYAGRYKHRYTYTKRYLYKSDPIRMRAFRRKYWDKYPEKLRAQKKLQSAVHRGTIKKGPCVVCGQDNVHGHHPDYSKPLDVIWLCPRDHKKVHSGIINL